MKKTTCRNLQGACDAEILGETPQEMGESCRQHVMKMVEAGDESHKAAIEKMMSQGKEDQEKWYEDFKDSFDSLPDAESPEAAL